MEEWKRIPYNKYDPNPHGSQVFQVFIQNFEKFKKIYVYLPAMNFYPVTIYPNRIFSLINSKTRR